MKPILTILLIIKPRIRRLTKDDADMYRSVPSHEIQSAALLAASGCCFSLILDRSPWLRQVVNRGRCLTEFVVKTTRTIEKKGKQVDTVKRAQVLVHFLLSIISGRFSSTLYSNLRRFVSAEELRVAESNYYSHSSQRCRSTDNSIVESKTTNKQT